MNKRAIIILGAIFILIAGTLGFLLYQRSQNNKTASDQLAQQAQNTQNNTNNNQDPIPQPSPDPDPTPQSGAVRLSDDVVISPVLYYQGNGISYFNPNGQFYQTSLTVATDSVLLSDKKEISIPLKSGLTRIHWPLTGNDFIAEYNESGLRRWSYFNSNLQEYLDYPPQVKSLDWMPDGKNVMMTWAENDGITTMYKVSARLDTYEKVIDMYNQDDEIKVSPDGNSVAFWRTQSKETINPINIVSVTGENYTQIVKEGFNLGVSWSPDSKKIVFGKRDGSSYGLWLADSVSGAIQSLDLNTVPEKVVWSKDNQIMYVAVPQSGTIGASLTDDKIIQLNIATAQQSQLTNSVPVDVMNMFLSPNNQIIFFKNRQDGALYYIPVTP